LKRIGQHSSESFAIKTVIYIKMHYEHLRIMCYEYKFFEIQFSRQRCKLILTIDFMYYHFLGLLELSPFYPFAETAKPILAQLVYIISIAALFAISSSF
jgi:hypothetical protein